MIIFVSLLSACKNAIELGVIMDASSSVKRKNYRKTKDFVKKFSDEFEISSTGTHMGIIHYSHYPRLDFTMADSKYHDRISLKAKIDSIVYSFGKYKLFFT